MCSKIFNMFSTYPKAALMAHDMADSAHWCTAALVRRWYHAVPCTTSSAPSAGCPRFPQWFGTLAILPKPQWKWSVKQSETNETNQKQPETAKALVQKTAKRCHNQCRFNGLQPSCGDGSAGHHTLKSSLHTELSKPLSIFKPKGECHRNYWCPWCQFCMLSFSEKGLALSLSFELILS
jgi:hypothetical protein